MSTRAIAVLGVIAAALLAYVLAFERTSVTSKELAGRAGRVLPSFVRDKVERITVQRASSGKGVDVTLARKREKDGLGALEMVAPLKVPADSDAGDRLLGELEWLSARRTVEDNGQFGLEKPRFRVSYEVGGETHVLAIGNEDVHGEGLYVRVDRDPKVFVVPRTLLEVIDHEPGHFRDKTLFPELTVAWANKLNVRNGSLLHELTKHDKHWWLEDERYADETKIDTMLRALSTLHASREVEPKDEAAAQEALKHVTLRVEVSVVPDETREDKKPLALELDVAGPCGKDERYARVATRLVCIKASELTPFELGSVEPIEPRLFRAGPNDIERFVISRGKDSLAWRREGSKWKSAVDAPADAAAIETWLRDLVAARASRTKANKGFVEQGKLRLELVGGGSEELAYAALTDEGLPVQRSEESVLVLFPATVHDRLAPLRERFQPLLLWSGHQPSEVVSFEAQVRDKQRRGTLVDGKWSAGEAARELIRALIATEALAYLGDTSRPEHGVDTNPRNGKLVFGLRDGKTLSVELGASTSRGVYARRGRDVLELSSTTLALIEELAGGPPAPHQHEEEEDEEDVHEGLEPHVH